MVMFCSQVSFSASRKSKTSMCIVLLQYGASTEHDDEDMDDEIPLPWLYDAP